MGQVIYFKVGQSLLQGGVGITKGQVLESGATITEKAIFVTLGQMKIYVYWQMQLFNDRANAV